MNFFLALIVGLLVTLIAGIHWGLVAAALLYLGLEYRRLHRRVNELEAKLQEGMNYLPDLVNQLWDLRQHGGMASIPRKEGRE